MSLQDALQRANDKKQAEINNAQFRETYSSAFPTTNLVRDSYVPKTSITARSVKAAPSAIGGMYTDYTKKQNERRAQQTFGQQAVTELVKQPSNIIKTGAQWIVGGLSEAGKPMQELAVTYGRKIFAGEDIGTARNKAHATVHDNPEQIALEKKLFGYEIQDIASYGEETEKFLKENNAKDWEVALYPTLIPIVALGAELMPGGGGKGAFTKKFLRELAEETSEEVVTVMLRKAKVPDVLIATTVKDLAEATGPVAVRKILKNGADNVALRASDEIAEHATKEGAVRPPVRSMDGVMPAGKVNNTVDTTVDALAPVRRGLDDVKASVDDIAVDLAEQAKHFDNADEFVKAQGEPMFHATRDTKMKSFDKEYDYELHDSNDAVGQVRDYETPYGKVFMTNNLKEAKAYGQNVLEVFYDGKNGKPKIKTIKTGDVPPSQYFDNEYNWGKLGDVVENGEWDILKFIDNNGKSTFISHPEQLLTKSQLEDIWNRANSGDDVARQASKPVDVQMNEMDDMIMEGFDDVNEATAKWTIFRDSAQIAWTKLRRTIEDRLVDLKRIQREGVVKEGANPWIAEVLSHGRKGTRVVELKEKAIKIDKDIIDIAKKHSINDKKLTGTINKYMIARHAPERIAAIGADALPISKGKARAFVDEIDNGPLGADVKRIADELQEINNSTLDILKEGGVIDQKLHTLLRTRYKNHVPLNRIMDETEDFAGTFMGAGTDVKGTGIKGAKGSQRKVDDILANILYNNQMAIVRAENNKVANEFYRMIQNNKNNKIFKDMFKRVKPDIKNINDPKVFSFFVNGKRVQVLIKDSNLAAGIKGMNRQQLPPFLNGLATFTRFYSGLMTRFSPEFALSNKVRDLQEAVVYAAANGQGAKAFKVVARDPKSMKTITDAIRGIDNADTRLYKQMQDDGGTTGGLALSTREDVVMDVAKLRKLNRSKTRRGAEAVVQGFDNWNTIFEDSTRFSVYKEALDQGMSRTDAAVMAKESTINFNKFGEGGAVLNGLYMFSNASIQGSAKMLRAMRNPKVAAATISSVMLGVYATGEWNDSVDPDWRKKVTEWDRMNSMPIVIPNGDGDFKYIVIPVSWGIKPIKVAADSFYDISTGNETDIADASGKIFTSLIEGYNPIGGNDVMSAIVPTFLDAALDISRNQAWHGGQIAPDWDKNAPDSTRYFDSMRDTTSGQAVVGITKALSGVGIEISPANMHYAYTQAIGGTGRFIDRVVTTVDSVGSEEPLKTKDIPFISRFYRLRTDEEIGAGTGQADAIRSLLSEQSRDRFYFNQKAEETYNAMISTTPEERIKIWNGLDSATKKKVDTIKKDEEKGLTYIDRMVIDLGVKNGERAYYIYGEIMDTPKEQRAELYEQYVSKKIISKEVAKQLEYLAANPPKGI